MYVCYKPARQPAAPSQSSLSFSAPLPAKTSAHVCFRTLLNYSVFSRQKNLSPGKKHCHLLENYTLITIKSYAIFIDVVIETRISLLKYRENNLLHPSSYPMEIAMEMDSRNMITQNTSTDRTRNWFTEVGADKTNEYVSSSFTCMMASHMLLLVARLSVSNPDIPC